MEADPTWFNQPRKPSEPDPDWFDQTPTWQAPEIQLDDGRILILENIPDPPGGFKKQPLPKNLGKAVREATLALNENRREFSRVNGLPARTGDFSYRNTAH